MTMEDTSTRDLLMMMMDDIVSISKIDRTNASTLHRQVTKKIDYHFNNTFQGSGIIENTSWTRTCPLCGGEMLLDECLTAQLSYNDLLRRAKPEILLLAWECWHDSRVAILCCTCFQKVIHLQGNDDGSEAIYHVIKNNHDHDLPG